MSFKEYFEMGQKQEQDRAKKAAAKTERERLRKLSRPSAASPASLLVGAGVLYEMVKPVAKLFTGIIGRLYHNNIRPTFTVISTDLKMLAAKFRKVNPDWERYKQFDDLARGKR